jgi:hypothetical protein
MREPHLEPVGELVLVPAEMIDSDQQHRLTLGQRTQPGDQDAAVQHRAGITIALSGSEIADHRPKDRRRQLPLMNRLLDISDLRCAEVKGDDSRAPRSFA